MNKGIKKEINAFIENEREKGKFYLKKLKWWQKIKIFKPKEDGKIYNNITWFFRRLRRVWDFLPIIWRGYDFDYSHAIGLFRYQLERTADLLESDKAYTLDSNLCAQKIRTAIRLMDKVYEEEYMEDLDSGKITMEEAIKKQEKAHQLLWEYIEHNIQGWWD